MLKLRITWSLLPKDFPPWSTVYRWFARFRDDGTWERINHHLVMLDRERAGRAAGRPTRPVQERCDPPVAVCRAGVGELPDRGKHLVVTLALAATTGYGCAGHLLDKVGPGDAKRIGHDLCREASRGGDGNCQTGFFPRAAASASLSTSTSIVLRPSRRSSSRTRCSSSRALLAASTSSSALRAT
jgi:hypothetical protein